MIKTATHQLPDSVDRLLIVGDIHSYLQPLQVFDALRARMAERTEVLFNGDLFQGGAKPVETAQWVLSNVGDLATVGNHDEAMLRGTGGSVQPPFTEAGAYQRLSKNQREYFRNRPHRLVLTWRGKNIVLMHGHIRMDGHPGSWMAPPEEQIARFSEPAVDLFVTSHTHCAFVREVVNGYFANTGSVSATLLGVEEKSGLHVQSGKDTIGPDDDRRSSFLSVSESEGSLRVDIERFEYDREAALKDLEDAGHPEIDLIRRWLTEGILRVY
jgi:predicted phosphodiesterase